MKVLLAAVMAAVPFTASAQDVESMTCATFRTMTTDAQIAALSTIQPLGDDMEASDRAASEQWAATVASACDGHPERLLTDAARDALGE